MFKNKKTAFIFPGQGAQYIEMAKCYLDSNPELLAVIDEFDKKHNTELKKIMLAGPEEELKQTKFTQPAILFHSICALKTLKQKLDIEADFVAGHSLGEFSALVANGVLNFADAMHLVHKRGEFMIKANDGTPFAMAAILKLSPEKIKEIVAEASNEGVVVAANFNTPVQTVISGTKEGVEKACELAQAEKGRVVPLVVGGPFHSPLIAKAAEWLADEMANITFNNTTIPVISNVDAKPAFDALNIKENLAKQVTSSVLWVDSMNYLIEQGVELFIEFGPKRVLAGMMAKINRKVKVISIDTIEDLDAAIEKLNEL